MKPLFVLCLALLLTSSSKAAHVHNDISTEVQANPVAADVGKVIGGVLLGLATDVILEDIVNCVTDVDKIGVDLVTAVKDFQKGSAAGTTQGLKEIAAALITLPSAITACKAAAYGDAVKLAEALAAFDNPVTFAFQVGKSIILNGFKIHKEISTAVKDWKDGDYFDFGYNIGRALGQVIGLGSHQAGAQVVQSNVLSFEGVSFENVSVS
jgi:hypothetical protein